MDSFRFGALVHGEVCCQFSVDFPEEADSSPQTSPHTQTTYLLRIFTGNFAGKTSPAKIHQQNLASYLHLRNRCVALVGTYTNMHVHQYGLGST